MLPLFSIPRIILDTPFRLIRKRILNRSITKNSSSWIIAGLKFSRAIIYIIASWVIYSTLIWSAGGFESTNPILVIFNVFFSIWKELFFVGILTMLFILGPLIQFIDYNKSEKKNYHWRTFFKNVTVLLFIGWSAFEFSLLKNGLPHSTTAIIPEFLCLIGIAISLSSCYKNRIFFHSDFWHIPFTIHAILITFYLWKFQPSTFDKILKTHEITSGIDLLNIALGALILNLVWRFGKFIRTLSNRIVVYPFETHTEGESEDLKALASIFTQSLISELHELSSIGKLRKMDMASPMRMETDEIKPMVTGAIGDLSLDNMTAITNVELAFASLQIPIPFAIYRWITGYFSKLQIKGTIIRRLDNSYEIYVEDQGKKANKPIMIQKTLVPKYSTSLLTESELCEAARQVALTLAMELGVGSKFFSRAEGLSEYLLGLKASTEKKWWLAISHYRRCIEIEETSQRDFGIGHYLLGSALISQGNYEKGLIQLRMAEAQGPQLAELHYVLALTLLYKYYFQLIKRDSEFLEMQEHCKKAISMKPNFAEAYHLLAKIYYCYARTAHREKTKKYKDTSKNPEEDNKNNKIPYPSFYVKSNFYFSRALRLYWAEYMNESINPELVADTSHFTKTLTELLIATHQKADALRGLKCYMEAKLTYKEVLVALPRNLRTLIDLAKTYCLNRKWKKARSLVENNIFIIEEGRWDADSHLYLGWAYSGLATNSWKRNERFSYLSKSFQHLDFALHQRPRFMARWGQNDWLEQFVKSYNKNFSSDSSYKNCLPFLYISILDNSKHSQNYMPEVFYWWLGFRHWLFGITDAKNSAKNSGQIIWGENCWESKSASKIIWSHHIKKFWYFSNVLREDLEYFCPQRSTSESIIDTSPLSRHFSKEIELRGFLHSFRHAKRGNEVLKTWQKLHKFLKQKFAPDLSKGKFTFYKRLWIELYAEYSAFACLVFATANDHIRLFNIAKSSADLLHSQIVSWRRQYSHKNSDKEFLFSPYLIRYQRASLHAWAAYAGANYLNEPAIFYTKTSENENLLEWQNFIGEEKEKKREILLEQVQKAFRIKEMHPLAMYVHAELLRLQNHHFAAISELERLLKKIEPLDPSRTIARPGRVSKSNDPQDSLRNNLYQREQLIGRLRFENFVNPTEVYLQLSKVYEAKHEAEECVATMSMAISTTDPQHPPIQYFLILANRLKNLHRFKEAFAVLDAIFVSLKGSRVEEPLPKHTENAIDILKTSLLNRMGKSGPSFESGQHIARNYTPTDFRSSWENLMTKVEKDNNNKPLLTEGAEELYNTYFARTEGKIRQKNSKEHEAAFLQSKQFINAELERYLGKIINDNYRLDTDPKLEKEKDAKSNLDKDNNFLKIPKIFAKQQSTTNSGESLQEPVPDFLFHIAQFWIYAFRDEKEIVSILDPNQFTSDHNSDSLQNWYQRLIMAFAESATEEIIRLSDLCNALAYSKAELDIRLDEAEKDSRFSIQLIYLIYGNLNKAENYGLFPRVRQKLAQYFDTLAWIYYRFSNKYIDKNFPAIDSSTHNRLRYLLKSQAAAEVALSYDPQKGIFYYHLARIHLTQLELHWQKLKKKSSEELATISSLIDKHLRLAFRYWRTAQLLPQSEREQVQLIWLGKRINTYQRRWDRSQLISYDQAIHLGLNGRNIVRNTDTEENSKD